MFIREETAVSVVEAILRISLNESNATIEETSFQKGQMEGVSDVLINRERSREDARCGG